MAFLPVIEFEKFYYTPLNLFKPSRAIFNLVISFQPCNYYYRDKTIDYKAVRT